MISTLDIHRAIVQLWDSNDIDREFTKYWSNDDIGRHIVLNDQEARPNSPFPYCTFDAGEQQLVGRSTGGQALLGQRQTRRHPITFNVHSKDTANKPAKLIAGELAEWIMRFYGGHPEVVPLTLQLDYGGVLVCQIDRDFGVKTGDEEYQWVVAYSLLVDVPVRVAN